MDNGHRTVYRRSVEFLIFIYILSMGITELRISQWNLNCKYNSAAPYLHHLMSVSDVLVLNEHGLFPCELDKLNTFNPEFSGIYTSSKELNDVLLGQRRGFGGCAILWRNSLSNVIRPLPITDSDRVCAIEINPRFYNKMFLVAVYMPHQTCVISNFSRELSILEGHINEYSLKGDVMVAGDMNCHIGREFGTRGWGSTTPHGHEMMGMLYRCNMDLIDIGNKGKGPNFTYHSSCGFHILTILPSQLKRSK